MSAYSAYADQESSLEESHNAEQNDTQRDRQKTKKFPDQEQQPTTATY